MKLDVKELIKSINDDVNLIGNLGEITEDNLKQLLIHLCDVYDKSAVIKVLKSKDVKTVVKESLVIEEVENKQEDEIDKEAEQLIDIAEKQIEATETKPFVEKIVEEVESEVGISGHNPKDSWEHKISLHEKIAKEKEDVSLAMKLQKKSIDNLEKAIGLNEKILFTNELFGKDSGAFKTHLENLNNKSSFEEAKQYLDSEIIPKYNWKGNDTSATHFITLLQRRFVDA